MSGVQAGKGSDAGQRPQGAFVLFVAFLAASEQPSHLQTHHPELED